MGKQTGIEWTQATWNCWIGCTKVSPGCTNCYMYSGMKRFGRDPTTVTRTKPSTFNSPLRWREPKLIFVCSWSDFFHKDADAFRSDAYQIMAKCTHHTFQLLTKRPERILDNLPDRKLSNIWIGTSVESKEQKGRIDILREITDVTKFLSCEPLLGNLGRVNLAGIDWVIAGGESGPKARPCELRWLRNLRNQCIEQDVPFFLKQLGGFPDKRANDKAVLDGERWTQMPNEEGR